MSRRVVVPFVAPVLSALLAWSCGTEPGIPPTFTRESLTHRGEHLVLDVAAVVLPDSTPANISCDGAVTASGVGSMLDSVAVVHHDTALVLRAICIAELGGASTADTIQYTLYGPSLVGYWLGRGDIMGQVMFIDYRSESDACANPSTLLDLQYGTEEVLPCVRQNLSTADTLSLFGTNLENTASRWRLLASRSDFLASEYRTLKGRLGTVRSYPQLLAYELRRY